MNAGKIRIKVYKKYREVFVTDTVNCKSYQCFHPHNCPIHGAKGINDSNDRWMCLTNVNEGCPKIKKIK